MEQQLCLGLDIGTTTISAVVLDTEEGSLIASRTVKSEADIPSPHPWEKMQDAALIERKARGMLEELLSRYPGIDSIGITGQMHGIVYLDAEGQLVSPLYTWQDQRSAAVCGKLQEATGYRLAPGYGLTTHCALLETGGVPAGAKKLCTIMDYLAFALCGRKALKIHSTNAASLGFFSLEENRFDETALQKAGVGPEILPTVTGETEILGHYRGIPVAVAIGDNQASFLGSAARPETTALANFGTGSQISLLTDKLPETCDRGEFEVRPFLPGSWLVCGSALCGGRAYALLERFFRCFAVACGAADEEQYAILNTLAEEGLARNDLPSVVTTFCGTRSDPGACGSVSGLNEENFTPAAFAAGTLLGMARELRQMLENMPGGNVTALAASGNAVRKKPALKKALEMVFGMPVLIPAHQEEAAFGAALFAGAAAGKAMESLRSRCIRCRKD